MTQYVILNSDNIILNTVMHDPSSNWKPPSGETLGEIPDTIKIEIGGKWDGTNYTAPVEVEMPDDLQAGLNKEQAKKMLEESAASDIVYSSLFTGVLGNYLKPSIANAGLDPDNLPDADKSAMNFGSGGNTDSKAWKDIWGSGQGIGRITDSPSVSDLVDRLKAEYLESAKELQNKVNL